MTIGIRIGLAALAAMTGGGAAAQEGGVERIEFAALEHVATPLPGVATAMVVGTFEAGGLYAAQGKMAQGSRFPPHTHPDKRLSIVTSGTMYLGVGETFDEAKLVAYPAGTMAVTPAGTAHFMAAPDGDVTVLEVGSGPTKTGFVAD